MINKTIEKSFCWFKRYKANIIRLEFSYVFKLKIGKPTTTKICYNCGSEKIARFPSLNQKKCLDCDNIISWEREHKQKPYY